MTISGSTANAALNPHATAPALTVTSPEGSTKLPEAPTSEFYGNGPNAYDQADPMYGTLSLAHVAVLRAAGTREDVIAQIAGSGIVPAQLEALITSDILANPEAWDSAVGQPVGTARAGLSQIPGLQFGTPDPGTGAEANASVSAGGGMSGWVKGAVGLAVAGAGFLLFKKTNGFGMLKGAAEAGERVAAGGGGGIAAKIAKAAGRSGDGGAAGVADAAEGASKAARFDSKALDDLLGSEGGAERLGDLAKLLGSTKELTYFRYVGHPPSGAADDAVETVVKAAT